MRFRTLLAVSATAPLLVAGATVPSTAHHQDDHEQGKASQRATHGMSHAASHPARGQGGRPFSIELTGAAEAPGPGDPDATGTAFLRLNQGQQRICFDLSWVDVAGTVTAAHIHLAPAGEPGPVVVPLFDGAFDGTDSVADCVDADRSLVKEIRNGAASYYVNVHSTEFPAGAVRGQLG